MNSLSPWTSFFVRCCAVLSLLAAAPVFVPAATGMPGSYVVDSAGVIDEGSERLLIGRLQELEQKTGTQMVVLTIDSTGGVPIEEYALDKAEVWRLGQEGRDNGLLFVVAMQDKRYRIETGYGLEAVLPDSLTGGIARRYLVPLFREGRFTDGISATVLVITDIIARSQGVTLDQPPAPLSVRKTGDDGIPLKEALFIILFLLMLGAGFSRLYPPRRGRPGRPGRHYAGGLPMARSRGFGGGFGAFGGGRGGGFGGGGVSGGW